MYTIEAAVSMETGLGCIHYACGWRSLRFVLWLSGADDRAALAIGREGRGHVRAAPRCEAHSPCLVISVHAATAPDSTSDPDNNRPKTLLFRKCYPYRSAVNWSSKDFLP